MGKDAILRLVSKFHTETEPARDRDYRLQPVAIRRHPKCNDSRNKCNRSFKPLRLRVDLSKSGAATAWRAREIVCASLSVESGDRSTDRTNRVNRVFP